MAQQRLAPFVRTTALAVILLAVSWLQVGSQEVAPPAAAPAGYHAINLTDDRVDAMRQTLAAVGRALQRGDGEAIAAQFDSFRMTVECRQRGGADLIPASQMAAFAEGIEQGLMTALAANARLVAFDDFEIQHCVMSDDNTSAIVLVREVSNELEVVTKCRWWFVARQDGWRIFDFEDLNLPIRFTDGMLAVLQARAKGGLPQLLQMQAIQQQFMAAANAVADGDAHQAETLLAELDFANMPPPLRATAWVARAAAACDREVYGDALRFVQQAEEIRSDMPVVDLIRARAFNGLGSYDLGLRHATKYWDLIGDDPDAFFLLGEAKRGLGQTAEAAEFYRKSLEDHPNYVDALAQLVCVEPELGPEQVLAHLRAMDNTDVMFDTICYFLMDEQDFDALDRVVAAYRRVAPLNTDVAYYGATVLQHRGQHDEAAAMVLPAVSRVDEDEKDAFVYLYVNAMVEANKPLQAYDNLPDKLAAFEWLAESLLDEGDVSEQDAEAFEKLFALHAATNPEDLLLPYFRARRLIDQEKPDEAAAHLEPLLASMPKEHEYAPYCVDWYLTAMQQAKRPVEAYAHVEDKVPAFETLASSLAYSDDGSEEARMLEGLIAAHREEHADDPNIAYYLATALLHRDKPQEAAELLLPAVKQLAAEEHEELAYYVDKYLGAMLDSGRPLDGYSQAPDAVYAFRSLAGSMIDYGRTEELESLAWLHIEKEPDDAWGRYYLGEASLIREAWQEAVDRFVAGRGGIDDQEVLHEIDTSLAYALFELGQFARAFELVDPDEGVMVQLAQLADSRRMVAELEQVLDIYKELAADGPAMAYFTAGLHAHGGEHEAAVALLEAHHDAIEAASGYGWQLDETVVHSLIALGRHDDAIAAATRDQDEEYPSILLASAHAAAGNVDATRQTLAAFFGDRPWYRRDWLYANSILGPALRSEAFTQLRHELDAQEEKIEGAPPSP